MAAVGLVPEGMAETETNRLCCPECGQQGLAEWTVAGDVRRQRHLDALSAGFKCVESCEKRPPVIYCGRCNIDVSVGVLPTPRV